MENQISCTPLFKRWVRFLKQKNLCGRYILCMHRTNRWKDNIFKNRRGNLWTNWTITSSAPIHNVSIRDIYLSKSDYFRERYEVNTLQELRTHLYNLGGYISYEEGVFWMRVYDEFRKVEERTNPILPVPRSFKNRGNQRSKVKGAREDNLPWYTNFYEDRKVLWRR